MHTIGNEAVHVWSHEYLHCSLPFLHDIDFGIRVRLEIVIDEHSRSEPQHTGGDNFRQREQRDAVYKHEGAAAWYIKRFIWRTLIAFKDFPNAFLSFVSNSRWFSEISMWSSKVRLGASCYESTEHSLTKNIIVVTSRVIYNCTQYFACGGTHWTR